MGLGKPWARCHLQSSARPAFSPSGLPFPAIKVNLPQEEQGEGLSGAKGHRAPLNVTDVCHQAAVAAEVSLSGPLSGRLAAAIPPRVPLRWHCHVTGPSPAPALLPRDKKRPRALHSRLLSSWDKGHFQTADAGGSSNREPTPRLGWSSVTPLH